MNEQAIIPAMDTGALEPVRDRAMRQGVLKLLDIKDSDIRMLTLEQCRDAVDQGLHAGGAFSATIPLVALYYGGFLNADVANPTKRGQDMFVLSKGHAVATLASIYADLGYFDRRILADSRSYESILNGHPGPLLPGVHLSTGPLGQGLSVAQGFALAGKSSPRFDVYCMTGDGELQEGPIWEAVMYSAYRRLDNLCVLVDNNNGQLDIVSRLIFPLPDLVAVFGAFGWHVESVDATQYDAVFAALDRFKHGDRGGKPTAIVCRTTKGHGAFSSLLNAHKAAIEGAPLEHEFTLQAEQRRNRVDEFADFFEKLGNRPHGERLQEALIERARQMHLRVAVDSPGRFAVSPIVGPAIAQRAPRRDKKIRYNPDDLPRIDKIKQYGPAAIVTAAMKVFALDSRVVSIDADLGTTSGLEAGIAAVDQSRALNVGVAEANMMNIGEAYAALGYNAWVSTFCPFFDWKVLRRIAVGYQERMETIAAAGGWLSEGHGLDLTFLATAPNFETRTNGATHMGNDDITVFDGIAHLKIVDVSCPRQLLAIMQWIMAGNRGLVYLRVMRTPSAVLYGDDYSFEFGRADFVRRGPDDAAVIVSSGRGVHEALAAAEECARRGLSVGVVDMPSIDEQLLLNLCQSRQVVCFAEQNNGYLWQSFLRVLGRNPGTAWDGLRRVVAVNTLGSDGRPRFIHSGAYEELLAAFRLTPADLAGTVAERVRAVAGRP